MRGLEFYGFHGVSAEERVIGHRFRLDIEALVRENASETDNVDDTVNYASLANVALEVSRADQYFTVERLVRVMAGEMLGLFPLIESVTLSIEKLCPPADFVAESVGVEFTLDR